MLGGLQSEAAAVCVPVVTATDRLSALFSSGTDHRLAPRRTNGDSCVTEVIERDPLSGQPPAAGAETAQRVLAPDRSHPLACAGAGRASLSHPQAPVGAHEGALPGLGEEPGARADAVRAGQSPHRASPPPAAGDEAGPVTSPPAAPFLSRALRASASECTRLVDAHSSRPHHVIVAASSPVQRFPKFPIAHAIVAGGIGGS